MDKEQIDAWTSDANSVESFNQRSMWNLWIIGVGPFKNNGPFQGIGGLVTLRALSQMAVHAIGWGNPCTYRRYAEEDKYGKLGEQGILKIFDDDSGLRMVEYRGTHDDAPEG